MIYPPPLKKGSCIGIISPAGKIDASYINYATKLLSAQGYKVILGTHTCNSHFQFAGSDKQRLNDLQDMINNAEVNAIFCSRGGYGTMRIIDQLDFSAFKTHPKWMIGFSDITVLHACLQNTLNTASIHGIMPKTMLDKTIGDSDLVNLISILKEPSIRYEGLSHSLNRHGEAKGTLIGGNLSLISALRGTPYDFDPQGKILFIEEVSEYLYSLDRMMMTLKLGGVLSHLKGLVVGQFTDMQDNEQPFGKSAYEIISDAVSEFNYPVIFDFKAGHSEINQPLILGSQTSLISTDQNYTLSF